MKNLEKNTNKQNQTIDGEQRRWEKQFECFFFKEQQKLNKSDRQVNKNNFFLNQQHFFFIRRFQKNVGEESLI